MMTAFTYQDGDSICVGSIAAPAADGRYPAILVAHNWSGQGPADSAVAERLAGMGYVGIAIDVYGRGVRGDPMGDNSALMNPWMADRAALRQRLLAAVDAAAADPRVDPARIAVIGYCFGGLCALDLARSADPRIRAAVSFHGVYPPPAIGEQAPMTAKVLVCDGWRDPMCPPAAKTALCEELDAAGADWQFVAYGRAYHAFTAPQADNPAGGIQYNEAADRRSWAAMSGLLDEVFG